MCQSLRSHVDTPRSVTSRNPYPLFISCESPLVNYLFIVRNIPQNKIIISSIILTGTVFQLVTGTLISWTEWNKKRSKNIQSQFKFIPIFIPFRRNGTQNHRWGHRVRSRSPVPVDRGGPPVTVPDRFFLKETPPATEPDRFFLEEGPPDTTY